MKGLRMLRILCVELLFFIQSVVGPHTQLCFSTCRKSAADCGKTFVSASLGDSVLHPEVFGAKTTVPNLAKNPGDWTAAVSPVVNLDTGKALFGWLHVKATGNPSAQTISIQAESQHSKTSGIGSFMFPSDVSTRLCNPTGGPEGILPCYMVKSPYHMPGTALGYSGASVNTFVAIHRLDIPPCPVFDSKRNFRYRLRKCHGVLMTIFTVFLLPVSVFLSRYFKETFMSAKLVHLPIWYAIHIHMSMSQLGTLSAGLISAIWARSFFGLSTYFMSIIHDAMGWVAVLFFLLAFLSSSFRLKVQKARLISIFLHCVWGNAVYGLCLIGMLTSCVMPGSPSTRPEVGHTENTTTVVIEPVFELGVLIPVLIGIVVDVVFNIVMMRNLKWADKKLGLGRKRKFAVRCVPIPLYNLNSKRDIPGGKVRKILLMTYILLSLLLTLGISVRIIMKPSKERFFGPMRYTHKPNGKLFAVNRIQSYHL